MAISRIEEQLLVAAVPRSGCHREIPKQETWKSSIPNLQELHLLLEGFEQALGSPCSRG